MSTKHSGPHLPLQLPAPNIRTPFNQSVPGNNLPTQLRLRNHQGIHETRAVQRQLMSTANVRCAFADGISSISISVRCPTDCPDSGHAGHACAAGPLFPETCHMDVPNERFTREFIEKRSMLVLCGTGLRLHCADAFEPTAVG